MKKLKKEPETEQEKYWVNVGAVAGLFAGMIIVLPIIGAASLGKMFFPSPNLNYFIYIIFPMITYLLILLIFAGKLAKLCLYFGINQVNAKEKKKHEEIPKGT